LERADQVKRSAARISASMSAVPWVPPQPARPPAGGAFAHATILLDAMADKARQIGVQAPFE
jgi:hypothetical protein